MNKHVIFIASIVVCFFLVGCGNSVLNENYFDINVTTQQVINSEKEENSNTETKQPESDGTMTIYTEAHSIKDYIEIKELLDDAEGVVKVKVTDAVSHNVRNYIYTSYQVRILDSLYGTINGVNEYITVNMPGGVIQGDEASRMIREVTEGKDGVDLPEIQTIRSEGNTDRLLQVGDTAYLFLIRESDEAYAVVGEYCGEVLVEGETVVLDHSINDSQNLISENEFIELVENMVSGN